MKYIVDIDGTICNNTHGDYTKAIPYAERIEKINNLYRQGHEIVYWTARGSATGKDWYTLTVDQLHRWGVLYTDVKVGKPQYDLWIDDKAMNSEDFFR